MKKMIIGDISGRRDFSGVFFDFLVKWQKTIVPLHLSAFLQGKNAFDGSFTDCDPRNEEKLLEELKKQLLSGAKSLTQFKLFIKKMDYTNPETVRAQEIIDFYHEVFGATISHNLIYSAQANLLDENFMYFSHKVHFRSDIWAQLWKNFHYGENKARYADDKGLTVCLPFNFNSDAGYVGSPPRDFLLGSIRQENEDYYFTYRERIYREGPMESVKRFGYQGAARKTYLGQRDGITLKEAFILLMFEYWRSESYFQHPEKGIKIAVPCYGSVCKDYQQKEKIWPIPLVIASPENIENTFASLTNPNYLPIFLVRDYRVIEVTKTNS